MTSAPLSQATAAPQNKWGTFERVVLVAVLGVLGLQYYMYDVMYRILAMPSLVVSVPAKAAPGTSEAPFSSQS
jgi:hypothetical protein